MNINKRFVNISENYLYSRPSEFPPDDTEKSICNVNRLMEAPLSLLFPNIFYFKLDILSNSY